MKLFFCSALASLPLADARILSNSDLYYWNREPLGSTMWVFNEEGLKVYSNDGSELKKEVGSDVGLSSASSQGGTSFYEIQSDGHKYVWVANGDKVEIFDIDTGDYAGYVPSCGNPAMELRYLPTRQEMWLRCARATDDEAGNIDVFSTNSLASNHEGILLPGSFNYGWGLEVHSTLGNYGYVSPYNTNYLYQIDLSSREITANFTFPEEVFSAYDLTYSPTNRHIYGKARVCCTCGTPQSDIGEDCGRGSNQVVVKTGPSASPNPQTGTCGGSCEGSVADTIGVFEFDTVSKTFVGTHNSAAGNGATPIASPDGKYIVLATHDGGETVRVLEATRNGLPSTVAADIPVGFGGIPGQETIADVAFIEDEGRNFMIIAGWDSNDVAIVDIDDNFRMVKISLTTNPEPTAAAGQRNVEWAVGSNYVWIDGPQVEEMYVLEVGSTIDSARVAKVIPNVKGGFVIHVDNYARTTTAATTPSPPPPDVVHAAPAYDTPSSTSNESPSTTTTNSQNAAFTTSSNNGESAGGDDTTTTEALSVAALIVATVALLWTIVLTVRIVGMDSRRKAAGGTVMGEEEGGAGGNVAADVVTLGSKQAV